MTITIPTMRDVWRALALFCYRRWATEGDPRPVGVPGQRDPAAPCDSYAPRAYRAGDFQDCQTDGHYLCRGDGRTPPCAHIDPALLRPEEETDGED